MLSDELLCEELSKRARELIFHDGLVLLKLVQEIQDGFFVCHGYRLRLCIVNRIKNC